MGNVCVEQQETDLPYLRLTAFEADKDIWKDILKIIWGNQEAIIGAP
jgi:hypothetical protein